MEICRVEKNVWLNVGSVWLHIIFSCKIVFHLSYHMKWFRIVRYVEMICL